MPSKSVSPGSRPVEPEPVEPEFEPDAPESSDVANSLVEAGARPVSVDSDELLRQIQRMQEQIAALNAQQGIPSDPVAAGVQNLKAHVKVRADANPGVDFKELTEYLDGLGDELSSKETEMVRTLVDDCVDNAPHVENMQYLRQLARDLHKTVLKSEGSTPERERRL